MIDQIKQSLKDLNLSENEVKVYVALTQLGESSASKIAKKANLPRTTAISILEKLALHNYISFYQYKGMKYYELESPKVLQNVFSHKLEIAQGLEDFLKDLYRTEAHFPFANVYDSKKSIKSFIQNVLTNADKKSFVYTIDVPHMGDYNKVLSESSADLMRNLKEKRQLTTKTLIPYGTFDSINPQKLKGQNIIIREMPETVQYKSSMWFIGNLLVLFSGKPPFIVSIHHKLILESLKSVYDFLWNISTPKN